MTKSNQFPVADKPKKGKLWYNGRVLLADKPFGLLQHKKKELIAHGYDKNLFKLIY